MNTSLNKNSYFKLVIEFKEKSDVSSFLTIVENWCDPILSKMQAAEKTYTIFDEQNLSEAIILFNTSSRKRFSLLRNTVHRTRPKPTKAEEKSLNEFYERVKYNPTMVPSKSRALTKSEFETALKKYENELKYTIKSHLKLEPSELDEYKGNDVKFLQDKKIWFKWEKRLYNILFNKYGTVKKADDRQIIFIQDEGGNCGKSKFLKYLYLCDPLNIGLLDEASAGQIKSSISKIQEDKRIFLIDLPRTESIQGTTDLMNVLESLKNGVCISNFYGNLRIKMTEPPHIIICGNRMPNGLFSTDRWRVYDLNKTTKDWEDITESKTKDVEKTIQYKNERLDLRTLTSETDLVREKNRIQKTLNRSNLFDEKKKEEKIEVK